MIGKTNAQKSSKNQSKSITISSSGTQSVTPDVGYDGMSQVDITTPSGSAATPATSWEVTPSMSVNTGTGVITATVSEAENITPTVSAGYVSSGTPGLVTLSGSNTLALSTKGAETFNVSSSNQTIAAGKFLTGQQTFRGVTTSNIAAGNIKAGVTIEVGDSVKSDRIISVTGIYSGGGATLQTKTNIDPTTSSQTITPDPGYDGLDSVQINAMPSGSATTPATTISASPSISLNTSTGEVVASVSSSSSITPTVVAGYVAAGTSGTVTVSGTDSLQLTTQGETTYNTSNVDQVIPAGTFLTGNQIIRCVTTSYLTANNIKSGVTVKVGDFGDSGRIKSVTGTYTGANSYTLLGSTTITTSSTSTTASSVGTLNLGSSAWDDTKILYVRIRGSRGKATGYFYGSDSFLLNGNAANSGNANATNFIRTIMRYYTEFTVNVYAGTTCYGIYPYSLSNTGVLNIYRRYNTSISGTINDTFTIQAYLLNTPDGVSPFA